MSDDLGFSTSLSECDFLVSFWGVSANATSIVHLCPRKPQCPHLYNGHNYKRDDADSVLSTESMSVHYVRPQWLLFSKLPRNFGKIPILFSKKKKKNPWERKMNTSPPFHSWKRCCEVRINTRAGLGVEMSVRAWARHCFWARQQGPVNGSDRTPDQKGDSAHQSVNVSAGDNGALPGEARPWGQQLLLQGSSVYSNQKAERNADCQGETFLGWTLRPHSFLNWQATSVLP